MIIQSSLRLHEDSLLELLLFRPLIDPRDIECWSRACALQDLISLTIKVLLLELLHLVDLAQMLQVEEVHEHLVLNLDVVREESGVESLVILRLVFDELLDLVSSLTVIVV